MNNNRSLSKARTLEQGAEPTFTELDYIAGLTKRELFAMTAMGHLAAAHVQGGDTFSRLVAEQAVEYADALLKALDK